MYPYNIIWNIDLYDIFIAVGIVAAIAVYRLTADKVKIGAKLFNFTLICAVCSIVIGFLSAVFFQALYNIAERGAFIIDKDTGATFGGGILGGTVSFFTIYLIFGRKADNKYKTELRKIIDCIACAVPAAHAFGRIGCLMDGCCYGRKTEEFYGIYMHNLGYKVVPTQLFEAIFLAVLATVLVILIFKGKKYTMSIYMISYGVWRFFIEFIRDDYRGTSFISFLTPSQIISGLLFIGGIILVSVQATRDKRRAAESE